MLVQHNVTLLFISQDELDEFPGMEKWLRDRCGDPLKEVEDGFITFTLTEDLEKRFNSEFDIVDGKGKVMPRHGEKNA
jgi:hypothetical protein